jgi:steroid Delta-isomerase
MDFNKESDMNRLLILIAMVLPAIVWAKPSTQPAVPENPVLSKIFGQLPDPLQPFALVVHIRARPGQGDALEAAFVPHVRLTRTEPGMLRFDFNRSLDDPDQFVLYERWANFASVEAHFRTPWMARVMQAMQDHAESPELQVFAVAAEPDEPAVASEQVRKWVTQYFAGTRSMDAAVWADAFDDNAELRDPVGALPSHGREQILRQGVSFVSAFKSVALNESFVSVVGNQAVAKWEGKGVTADGKTVVFHGVNHFTFSPDGKISRLVGYWDPAEMKEVKD